MQLKAKFLPGFNRLEFKGFTIWNIVLWSSFIIFKTNTFSPIINYSDWISDNYKIKQFDSEAQVLERWRKWCTPSLSLLTVLLSLRDIVPLLSHILVKYKYLIIYKTGNQLTVSTEYIVLNRIISLRKQYLKALNLKMFNCLKTNYI